jgi:cytochrome b561
MKKLRMKKLRMKKLGVQKVSVFFTLIFCLCSYLSAETLDTHSDSSTLSFSGEHAGRAFKGQFKTWKASLVLPPDANPSIVATFDLSSARTGNALYDETLLEEDWFNVAKYPKGKFTSTAIEQTEKGFKVKGELTLRNKTQVLEFVLTPTKNGYSAEWEIDRLQFDIGKDSDPSAEWVSQYIQLTLAIRR